MVDDMCLHITMQIIVCISLWDIQYINNIRFLAFFLQITSKVCRAIPEINKTAFTDIVSFIDKDKTSEKCDNYVLIKSSSVFPFLSNVKHILCLPSIDQYCICIIIVVLSSRSNINFKNYPVCDMFQSPGVFPSSQCIGTALTWFITTTYFVSKFTVSKSCIWCFSFIKAWRSCLGPLVFLLTKDFILFNSAFKYFALNVFSLSVFDLSQNNNVLTRYSPTYNFTTMQNEHSFKYYWYFRNNSWQA